MPASLFKRYLAVGGASFAIELATLYVFKNIFKLNAEAAVAISFWVGFVIAFTLQKRITYKNKHKAPRMLAHQLGLYSGLVLINYFFTLLMVHSLKSHLSVFVIRSGVVGATTFWNFFAYKIIFKQAVPNL